MKEFIGDPQSGPQSRPSHVASAAAGPNGGSPHVAGSLAGGSHAGANLLFLREEEIRLAQDMLFFAYRDFTNAADQVLEELGLGRAHHRALHFVGRQPGITVSELLGLLRITKQSLARVLSVMVSQGYIAQASGPTDRRQRLLSLTPSGQALERRLFERQRERLVNAYREAGGPAVEGFRRVMRGIMDEQARAYLDHAEAAAREPRARSA
jgi:DNA-binding MarR family transcriptional regulator